ncbi:MAG: Ig-like domain-containing protein [Planctomycetota bacterium]
MADDGTAPPVLGSSEILDDTVRFRPRFPFRAGVTYRVRFDPPRSEEPIETTFLIPRPPARPTNVVEIYPTADVVPENLLRFYIVFSASMSRGEAYEHLHLRDAAGRDVDLPFLEQELWDPEASRLTLLIDPGRIKREVRPLEEVGPALTAGGRYTLVVDPGWRDAQGNPLASGASRTYRIAPPDHEPIDPARWSIHAPTPGTRDPLRVELGESLDAALLQRVVWVERDDGEPVNGRTTLGAREQQWLFTPDQPWASGLHQLVVDRILEDLAGNSVGRAFEVPIVGSAVPVGEWDASKRTVIPFFVD